MFETFVDVKSDPMMASNKFYRTNELGPISNWSGPTPACVSSWMKDAGFDVYIGKSGFPAETRQIFVGVVDAAERIKFDRNPNLFYCDEHYWQQVFETTRFK